jgi:DNA-directed RNA polymerase subunit RPC12/RpoP
MEMLYKCRKCGRWNPDEDPEEYVRFGLIVYRCPQCHAVVVLDSQTNKRRDFTKEEYDLERARLLAKASDNPVS